MRNEEYYACIGPIPSQLGNLTDLEALGLSNNKLSGVLAFRICLYQSIRNVEYYEYIGSIPSQLGQLAYLADLDLSENELTGNLHLYQSMRNDKYDYRHHQFQAADGKCCPLLLCMVLAHTASFKQLMQTSVPGCSNQLALALLTSFKQLMQSSVPGCVVIHLHFFLHCIRIIFNP